MSIVVLVNGEPRDLPDAVTAGDLVTMLAQSQAGVAVAVNGEVVPRRSWPVRTLRDRDRVEVVTAVQGG